MNLVRTYRSWRRYNETARELNRLSNRQLADLGVNRADIYLVARSAS